MDNISFFDRVYHYQNIDSTFNKAKKLIKAAEAQGNFLVIADKQTFGVGRRGSEWYSPQGGLWFHAGIYSLPVKNGITIYTALKIIKAICSLYPETGNKAGLKWPNDIILAEKKLGGILTSYYPSLKYLLIGVGLNTNNKDLPANLSALSLSSFLENHHRQQDTISKKDGTTLTFIDHSRLLNAIFDHFGEDLSLFIESGLKPFLEEYYRYSILEHKKITLSTDFQDFTGFVKGINKEGALLLEMDDGLLQPFLSGSVK